jgi:serine-type D-Ala-D-Ala carboxypeptidase/endopeptidase (penicillin-binding protein 4)
MYALIVVTAALAAYGLTITVRGADGSPAAPSISLPSAVARADQSPRALPAGDAGTMPNPSAVAAALAGPAAASALGGRLLAHVVDARTGTVLYDRSGATPAAPASTAKLLTAAAILTARPPTARFTTTVVAGKPAGTVVLVGGGDPTLTGAAKGKPGAYPDAARMSDLAAQLSARHVHVTRILVDSALFAGPSISPDWDPGDVPTSYGAPITALMVDGGRGQPGDAIRSGAPDLAAGAALAARLGSPQLPVSRGVAPAHATRLAAVSSAPLGTLVDQMLQESDNVIADVLARQVALAEHASASFLGAAAAVRTVLARLGVQVGAGMRDGSGLAADDRVSPAALTEVLRLIAGTAGGARAAGARTAYDALPVAGWSGTLKDRYGTSPVVAAAGRVRGKTGTLTGVSSLAGAVRDAAGRLLVFALDADRAPPGGNYAAEAALDRVAATLAACGCR